MNHGAFFRLLKAGGAEGIFLFHGEEEYIKRRALEALVELLDPVSRELNMAQYRSPLFQDMREACEALPFFSERRLVVCYDMHEDEAERLADYAKTMPGTTTLVLFMRGGVKKEFVKLFEGRDVHFCAMDELEALRFIEKRARARGVSVTTAVLRRLVEMVGVEAYALENAFFNAADYAGENGVITEDILERCVTPRMEYQAFRIIDRLVDGKKAEAMLMLRHAIKLDTSGIFKLAHIFTNQVKGMLTARQLLDSGVKEKDIASRMGVQAWQARPLLKGAKLFTERTLRAVVTDFAGTDYMQVKGFMPAERVLELTMLKYF